MPSPKPRIIVAGSTNTDLVVSVPQLPSAGETIIGGELQTVAGGKGANQAVAAARLGGDVAFISRVGDDDFGRVALANMQRENIDIQHVLVTPDCPSGVALIAVAAGTGENLIVVAPGANARLSADDVHAAAELFDSAQAVVVSLEIPDDAVACALALAAARSIPVILNPAPARHLAPDLLARIDVITPNEKELALLGGTAPLLAAGVRAVVCTQGAAGATLVTHAASIVIPAPIVQAVDTVAAGDCFTAALAVELARGSPLREAVQFAIHAASLKVTRHGAQPGIPHRDEVLDFQTRTA